MNNLVEKIIKFISDYEGIDSSKLNEDTDLINDIGMASIDIMEMCCQIEEDYNIEIDLADLYSLKTIKEVAEYIESAMNNE